MPITVSDSESESVRGYTNSYTTVVSTYDPTCLVSRWSLYVATDVVSSQSDAFTLTCSVGGPDAINLFALEFSDLAGSASIVDASASNYQDMPPNPFPCGTLSTTAIDDLIVSLYNSYTGWSPAGIAPTLGTIPACNSCQGGQCVNQNGVSSEVGGLSVYTADIAGRYTPA